MYQLGEAISAEQAQVRAIEVAKKGLGMVSPNPLVGCVIVDKNHKFVSEGAHLKAGQGHAEVNALAAVKDKAKLEGATLYVTLEPCAHQGKTGACADVLAPLPIKKVVYGLLDPNPEVAGKGVEKLVAAGKQVESFSTHQKDCERLAEQFLFHVQRRRPFISLKVATSLDGVMALQNGQSHWITGERARAYGRALRAHYDATMIGAGTLLYDDPRLDFRETEFAGKKDNKIILVDPKGVAAEKFSETNLAKIHEVKNIIVLTRKEHVAAWSAHLTPVIEWESSPASWKTALKNLYQRGITSIYCEGGSYVFGQLLTHGYVQKIYQFQAPVLLGNGISFTRYFAVDEIDKGYSLEVGQSIDLGTDRLSIFYSGEA